MIALLLATAAAAGTYLLFTAVVLGWHDIRLPAASTDSSRRARRRALPVAW